VEQKDRIIKELQSGKSSNVIFKTMLENMDAKLKQQQAENKKFQAEIASWLMKL